MRQQSKNRVRPAHAPQAKDEDCASCPVCVLTRHNVQACDVVVVRALDGRALCMHGHADLDGEVRDAFMQLLVNVLAEYPAMAIDECRLKDVAAYTYRVTRLDTRTYKLCFHARSGQST